MALESTSFSCNGWAYKMRSTHEEGAQICLVTQGNACGALKVWVVCEYKATHHFIFLFPERWMILKKIKRERACVSVSVSGDGVPQLYLVKDHVFAFFFTFIFFRREDSDPIYGQSVFSSPLTIWKCCHRHDILTRFVCPRR